MQAVGDAPPYPVVSVARLARYITKKLGDDPKLRRLGVRGEVWGLTTHGNGNLYFDLKDREALIRCIAWSDAAASFPPLVNGQEIVAVGSVGTFAKRSSYQLVVIAVEHAGLGRLHATYEALKLRLQNEGLFSAERKRPLPRFPFRVALVSSRNANGAADFVTQAAARAPQVTIDFFETPVQGENAAPEIVRALHRASVADVDLVVLARGGGSFEDLFVFNDERVVRALARCSHPTVSAIGHEADAPLTDFVADHRAPTPSAAAQTVLPRRIDMLADIAGHARRLDRSIERTIERSRRELAKIELRSPLWSPQRLFQTRRQIVDTTAVDLHRAAEAQLRARRTGLAALGARLERCTPGAQLSRRRERAALAAYRLDVAMRASLVHERGRLNAAIERTAAAAHGNMTRRHAKLALAALILAERDPTRILQRGYAIVTVNGNVVRDAAAVPPGTLVVAQLARGRLAARVETTADDGGE